MAKLYFKYATMSAGKSLYLLSNAYNLETGGIPFICLKPSVDTRDGVGVIKSRAGLSRECTTFDRTINLYDWVKALRVEWLLNGYSSAKFIFIDEAQFMTKEQVDQVAHIVDNFDINVICYGLRTDFTLNLFEGSKRLFELADDIEEIKISCHCERKAIVNARIDEDGKIVTDGEQIMIGGNDMYMPMCRKCYFDAIENNGIKME